MSTAVTTLADYLKEVPKADTKRSRSAPDTYKGDRARVRDLAATLTEGIQWTLDDSPEVRLAELLEKEKATDAQREEALRLRNTAIKVLTAPTSQGGDGQGRAATYVRLRTTRRDPGLTEVQVDGEIPELRKSLTDLDGTALSAEDAALLGQARVLWADAIRGLIWGLRAAALKEMALGASPDAIEQLHALLKEDPQGEANGTEALEALAKELAEREVARLIDVADAKQRLGRTTSLTVAFTSLISGWVSLRNLAVKILLAKPEEGGEGYKKVPLAAQLRLSRSYFYQTEKVTAHEDLRAKRLELKAPGKRRPMEPYACALLAQANVTYWKALDAAATAARTQLVKELAAGVHYGRELALWEIGVAGAMDSAMVVHCLTWSGEGSRQKRIAAAKNRHLTAAAKRVLAATGDDGILSTHPEDPEQPAVHRNVIVGLVNQGLAERRPEEETEDGKKIYSAVLTEAGQAERAALLPSEAA